MSDETTIVVGAFAEDAATTALRAAGYHVVERNYRCKSGELDIVARDGDVLVFVEVRSRNDPEHGNAAQMVGRAKQRQVVRVAAHYLHHRQPVFDECRFDVVAITGGTVELYKDAFRA
jgi:putative endonuclease